MPDTLIPIGTYPADYNTITGQTLPCGTVYQSSGLVVHIRKKHPSLLGNVLDISKIISSPDYIGHNTNEPDSVELVKVLGKNLQVCIKLDTKQNYLYVASLYDITEAKLNKRIASGRLKKVH